MRRTLFHLGLAATCAAAHQDPTTSRPSYKLFRYDKDWSYLADPADRGEWVDAVKYIPLALPGPL